MTKEYELYLEAERTEEANKFASGTRPLPLIDFTAEDRLKAEEWKKSLKKDELSNWEAYARLAPTVIENTPDGYKGSKEFQKYLDAEKKEEEDAVPPHIEAAGASAVEKYKELKNLRRGFEKVGEVAKTVITPIKKLGTIMSPAYKAVADIAWQGGEAPTKYPAEVYKAKALEAAKGLIPGSIFTPMEGGAWAGDIFRDIYSEIEKDINLVNTPTGVSIEQVDVAGITPKKWGVAAAASTKVLGEIAGFAADMFTPDTFITKIIKIGAPMQAFKLPNSGLTLSKQGGKTYLSLKQGFLNAGKDLVTAEQLAEKAITESVGLFKYVDRGGIKILGQTVPKTPEIMAYGKEILRKGYSKFAAYTQRGPGGMIFGPKFGMLDNQQRALLEGITGEMHGYEQVGRAYLGDLFKNMDEFSQARLMLAIDSGKIGFLTDHQLAMRGKEVGAWLKELYDFEKEAGIDLKYFKDYITHIYKNVSKSKQVFRFEKAARRTKGFDPYAQERAFESLTEAFKVGLDKPSKLKVDKLIDDIIINGNPAALVELQTLTKQGLRPNLNLNEVLQRRLHTAVRAATERKSATEMAIFGKAKKEVATIFKPPMEREATGFSEAARMFGGARKAAGVTEESTGIRYSRWQEIRKGVENLLGKQKTIKKAVPAPKGMVEYNVKGLENMYIPEEVATALNELSRIPTTTKWAGTWAGDLLGAYDRVFNWFKGSVTILFPSFHTRNAASNVILNSMDLGPKAFHPKYYTAAKEILDGKEGMLLDNFGNRFTYDMIRKLAKENKVIVDFGEIVDVTGGKMFLNDMAKTYNPFYMWARQGRKAGKFIENDARMANFIANIEIGRGPAEAALRTRKFLLDYGGLSSGEREVMARLIPFFTFKRYNFPLTLELALKEPGRLLAPQKVLDALTGHKTIPDWLPTRQYSGTAIQLTDNEDINTFAVSLGLPLEDAMETFGILKDPEKLFGSTSPILKAPFELLANRNFYFKKPLQDKVPPILEPVFKALPDRVKSHINYRPARGGYKVDPWALYFFNNFMLSRVLNTSNKLLDARMTWLDKLLLISGPISTKTFSEEIEKDQIMLQNYIEGKSLQKDLRMILRDSKRGKSQKEKAYEKKMEGFSPWELK